MKHSAQRESAQSRSTNRMRGSARLRWRIVSVLLLAALIPLGVVGIGARLAYGDLLEQKSLELQREVVRSHAATIDVYIKEALQAVGLVAGTTRVDELMNQQSLASIFEQLKGNYGGPSFVDLGLISADGSQLAYVGPYDLEGRNYAGTEWFQRAMASGFYASDVFLGYRNVPHWIVAVRGTDGDRPWILRATIDSGPFEGIVAAASKGAAREVFIVNEAGRYQTRSPDAELVSQWPFGPPAKHEGVEASRIRHDGADLVQMTTWLQGGRWMLVMRQNASETMAPLERATAMGAFVALLGVAILVVITLLATLHLTRRIDRAVAARDRLSKELIRSAKLASVGELATGLAHEINNPLAIISSERTNLADAIGDLRHVDAARNEMLQSTERIRRQVERCSSITAKMLQFGHKAEATPQKSDIRPRLREVAELLQSQAQSSHVDLEVNVGTNLPKVVIDETALEQVLFNLINNSLYATKAGGRIRMSAQARGDEVVLEVEDNGSGISPEDLEHVFEPFFTTKPPGRGTGLGLSVCYGIVRSCGGTIEAESTLGQGTIMRIRLPIPVPERFVKGCANTPRESWRVRL